MEIVQIIVFFAISIGKYNFIIHNFSVTNVSLINLNFSIELVFFGAKNKQ
jgi:hypothetical protein